MCDVPSMAVFCSESIECFPGTASKFFLKLLVTIPVAPIIIIINIIIKEERFTRNVPEGRTEYVPFGSDQKIVVKNSTGQTKFS
jgi:hypothetical protein